MAMTILPWKEVFVFPEIDDSVPGTHPREVRAAESALTCLRAAAVEHDPDMALILDPQVSVARRVCLRALILAANSVRAC
jgi:hypothetical protein